MSLSQLVLDAIDRLKQYNLGVYNAGSNKFGLSGVGGMAANWSRHSKDIATTCEAVGTLADAASASQTASAGSATAAAGSAAAAHTSELAAAGSATAAAGSAAAASGSATAAAGSASTASTKAGEAAASATAAAGSASTATTKAGEAAGSATAAAGSATAANNSKVAAATSEGNAAASATAAAGSATAAATDRTTVLAQVALAQAAQTASAASAVLAQQYVGTATNVIVPAINYRLASAWDANGQPTAYTLTGVMAVHRYDTRLDWDRGAWRKGKLARQSSWYQEALNTATRGSKREFPVVALIAATGSQVIIYDQNDLDANGSPRMWMVVAQTAGAALPLASVVSIFAMAGRMWIGVSATSDGMLVELDFSRDQVLQRQDTVNGYVVRGIANRNTVNSRVATQLFAGLVSYKINSVHARVLTGAPLDPVSRLPVPTILAATAGGVSVIHPTGLVASITGSSYDRAIIGPTGRLYLGSYNVPYGPLPYSNLTESAWRQGYHHNFSGTPSTGIWLGSGVNSAGGLVGMPGGFARAASGAGLGFDMVAEDPSNPAASMVARATKDYSTGWMPGDTRLAAMGDGAGSNGVSGGELVANGANLTSTTGWSSRFGATLTVAGGALRVTSSGTLGQGAMWTINTVAGVQYTVSFDVPGNTTTYYYADVTENTEVTVLGPSASGNVISTTGARITFVATSSQSKLRLFTSGSSGQYVDYTNISCRKTGTFSDAVTGSGELVTNGDFSSTTGWTQGTGWAIGSGVAAKTAGTASNLTQPLAITIGQTYAITYTLANVTAGTTDIWLGGVRAAQGRGANGTFTDYVTAATTDVLSFSAGATFAGSIDNVTVKLSIPDRSYKGKGLIVNGTLMRAPVATGSDLYAVNGFSAANYLEQPYNSDMDVGTGDAMWAMWFTGVMSIQRAYHNGSAYIGAIMRLINTGALIRFSISDGTTQAIANAAVAVPGGYHLAVGVLRRATQTVELWLDGVLLVSVSAASVGTLNNSLATTRVGKEHDGSVWGDNVVLPRFAAYAPTPNQIRRLYADESALFQSGSKAFLGGSSNSVQSLSMDEDTGVLSVATADGVDQFAGLRRVGRIAANTQGIGAELVSNGGFDTNTTGWTPGSATTAVSGGVVTVTNSTSGGWGGLTQDVMVTPNKTYVVTVDMAKGSAGAWVNLLDQMASGTPSLGSGGVSSTTLTPLAFRVTPTSAKLRIALQVNGGVLGDTAKFDNVSVKEAGAVTSTSVTSIAAGGGTVLVGTANEAGVVTELMPVKDELRQAPATSPDVVFDCTTTDATLTNAGRLFVSEGESLLIDALVESTEYGLAPVEGCSFRISARVRRNLNGNITLTGSSLRDVVDRTTSTLDANISVDTATQTVLFTVTGKTGVRLNWRIIPRLVWLGDARTAA